MMDNLPLKLKSLAQNRYFAVAAVVFFAFITAFLIALMSIGGPSTQDLRDQVRQNQGLPPEAQSPSEPGQEQSGKKSTVLERIMAGIGLKRDSGSSAGSDGEKEKTSSPSQQTDYTTTVERLTENAPPLPKVQIAKYNLETSLPSIPGEVKIYTVKTNYTQAEAELLARSLGFAKVDVAAQSDNGYELYDVAGGAYLSLTKSNGEFLFMSNVGIDSGGGESPRAAADAFVDKTGLKQECVRSYSSYGRTSQPGSTFIEFHCDWGSFGGPIYSSVGVLNLPETVTLASLKVSEVRAESTEDPDIINTSDGADAQERATDFNTLLVEVRNTDNRILAVSSNIPQIISTETITTDKVIPPGKIIENLEAGRAQLSLAAPSGDGFLDLGNIFSAGQAVAPQVDVRDLRYGYDFLPGLGAQYRCPVYFVRSFGDTRTGYGAEFVQTIPAVSDLRCDASAVLGETTKRADKNLLAQAKADKPAPSLVVTTAPDSNQDDSLKYGSFRFIPDAQIPPEHEKDCPVQDFTNAYKSSWDPNLYIAWIDRNSALTVEGRGGNTSSGGGSGSIANRTQGQKQSSGLSSMRKPREWWAVRVAGEGANLAGVTLSSKDRTELLRLRGQMMSKCKIGRRDQCPLPAGFNGQIISCSFLTTASPRLHLYPEKSGTVSVSVLPLGKMGYTDPVFNALGGWDITALPNGSLTASGAKKDSLYWEFEKAPVLASIKKQHQADSGFIVKKSELESFIKFNVVSKLGLTEEESTLWIAEILRESKNVTTQYVKLSFIDSALLDTVLTTNIEPIPTHFHRLMLLIESANSLSSMPAPALQTLERNGFTVIETGVLVSQ